MLSKHEKFMFEIPVYKNKEFWADDFRLSRVVGFISFSVDHQNIRVEPHKNIDGNLRSTGTSGLHQYVVGKNNRELRAISYTLFSDAHKMCFPDAFVDFESLKTILSCLDIRKMMNLMSD